MKKLILIFLLSYISFSNNVSIKDDNNILGIKSLFFVDEKDLQNKLNNLALKMVQKGYITSKIKYSSNLIEVIPGRINKIVLNDKNSEIKEKLLNLNNLEGNILNIKDIDNIVTEYEKIESNEVKIDIDKDVVYITNKYTPKFNVNTTLTYDVLDKKIKYNVGAKFSQPLQLNDEISLNLMYMKNLFKLNTDYNILFLNSLASINFNYTTQKIDENIKSYDYEFGLGVDKTIYKDKLTDTRLIYNTKLNISKQKIRTSTSLKDKIYFDNSINILKNKYYILDKGYFLLKNDINLNLGYVNNRLYKKQYMPITLKLNNKISSKYIDIDTNIFTSIFNAEEDFRYSFSSSLSDINSTPIELQNSKHALTLGAKLKYPIVKNDFNISPFIQVGLGVSEKEFDFGGAIGVEAIVKKINAKLRYGINKDKKQSFIIQIGVSIY